MLLPVRSTRSSLQRSLPGTADASKAAKNRGRSHTEMEERAKAEPIGINILGEGDKCDAGLAGEEDFFFLNCIWFLLCSTRLVPVSKVIGITGD